MRTTELRLRELVESTKYKKDFEEVKNSILASEKKEPPDLWFTEVVDPNTVDMASGRALSFTLKEVQALLKKGNLNNYYLIIPSTFSYFKMKYKLEFFFDPGRAYPQGFDPFNDIPLSVHSPLTGQTFAPFYPDPLNTSNDKTKVLIMFDITYPLPVLEKRIKAKLKFLKKIWELKEERKQRYPEDEVYRVGKLVKKGMNAIEITRLKYPGFNPRDDYIFVPKDEIIDGKKVSYEPHRNKEAWRYYIRTQRLINKAIKRGNFDIQLKTQN